MADSSADTQLGQPQATEALRIEQKDEVKEESKTETMEDSNVVENATAPVAEVNTDEEHPTKEEHPAKGEEQAVAKANIEVHTDAADDQPEGHEGGKAAEEGSPKEKPGAGKPHRTPPSDRKEKKRDDISDEQRKAKIEELRKKKITDYKKKEDEKRKAVLERKKKLDEAEREKNEALLKKISSTPPKRPASAPARRAVSFSSLAHLKKTHAVTHEIDIGDGKVKKSKEAEDKATKPKTDFDRRRTLPPRPASAMERKRPNSFSSDKGTKPSTVKNASDAATKPASRPRSSIGNRVEPKIRQSLSNLPNRPASAAASHPATKKSDEAKAKSSAAKPKPSMPPLPGKPLVPPNREMKKAKSTSAVAHHGSLEKGKGPVVPETNATGNVDKAKPKVPPAKVSSAKPKPKPDMTKPKPDMTKPQRPSTGKAKESPKEAVTEKQERKPSKDSSPATKQSTSKKAGIMDEAEAKRLMAEKRRQVKEEQERKKLEEENRLEEERIRKEEEQRKRAEELQKEQERQKAHLEELRKEAEEREREEKEEKLRKEMEEKERLEAEKKQRQEEIDRRAQEEVEKRAKEREQKRQQEEAERLERKKRVQEILGSRLRGSPVADRPVSPTPFLSNNSDDTPTPNSENSPPAIDTATSARDRVQKLLEKNQRKSEDSLNGSENDETPVIIKPQSSPAMPSPEHKGENLSEQTSTADAVKTNGQPPVDDASLESSLIEADKQTMEEERRKNIDNVDHLKNNGAENLVESSKENINVEENQNIEIKAEEKRLWNEAETVMGGSNDSVLNSSDKQTNFEQTQSSQESALWHLVEGKLELEECF